MRNTCTITRKAETVATNGATTTAWSTIASGVTCSIQTQSGREALEHFRITGRKLINAYFPPATDIKAQDVLTTIAGGGVVGIAANLSVKSQPIDHSGRGAYIMVVAEEIGGFGAS
jgi:predicted DsbA family dithiol-disulfide isomerase